MPSGVENGPFEPLTLEERIGAQALAIDLRQAVLACLAGAESRRWTVGELFLRLKGLGVPGTRASVARALSELGLELELCPWAPWRLIERGQEWALTPKSELAGLLCGVRALPISDPGRLSDEHKAVLLVVIGHRRKGGVSKTRLGEILGLDAARHLEELARLELVYADPARELAFWRPRPEALLALGFRSGADVPALKELEDWFDGQRLDDGQRLEQEALAKARPGRRLKRERERRASVKSAAGEPSNGAGGGTPRGSEEGRADLLGGHEAPSPTPVKRRSAWCRTAARLRRARTLIGGTQRPNLPRP
jgi:hypothetical protein